jgi:NADH-quinone oxidoreductase subunit J
MGIDIAFWILAVVSVAAALAVVLQRNVFRTALALILCLITVAGIYITLSADFLAGVQILVYVGGVSILVIMSIMLTRDVQAGNTSNKLRIPALVLAVIMLGVMIYSAVATPWAVSAVPPQEPTTLGLAKLLLGENGYLLAVETAAALLLATILGAIVLVREK